MASKVFLFNKDHWIYCNNVRHIDNVWSGWVVNGAYYMIYDEVTLELSTYQSKSNVVPETVSENIRLTWACDNNSSRYDYQTVICYADKEYESGVPADFELTEPEKTKYEDEVPF